ncbi:hypothetical protein Sango_1729000 [Sesamum angolense]|uniref:Uncharacterized protein n=1 Tax=Sesamum angolense TaxID=2727404 RepID=A0AAE2BS35_9LAMI|nr:hypothetical protein Sango_1729000 [Sesamum angolense]
MALAGSSSRILCTAPKKTPYTRVPLHRPFLSPSSPSWSHHPRSLPLTVSASPKKFSSSSRTGRFDSKNRRTSPVTTEEVEEAEEGEETAEIAGEDYSNSVAYVIPGFPTGTEPDFWEGPQWDGLGFFVQYMWAFGILFAVFGFLGSLLQQYVQIHRPHVQLLVEFARVAGSPAPWPKLGIAVVTYNDGATDFKDTPVYKESIQSQELLEEPDASNSDVFESNPTEQAPSLE